MAGGVPLWFIAVAIGAFVVTIGLVVLIARSGGGGAEIPCAQCGKMMMPGWEACMFCKAPRAGAAPTATRAELEFVSGPLKGTVLPLDRDVSTIGSAPGNTVLLTDTGVSRKHAGIRRTSGNYELADFGSTNGVYVNGEKVARRRLVVGDIIRVGATELVFRG